MEGFGDDLRCKWCCVCNLINDVNNVGVCECSGCCLCLCKSVAEFVCSGNVNFVCIGVELCVQTSKGREGRELAVCSVCVYSVCVCVRLLYVCS